MGDDLDAEAVRADAPPHDCCIEDNGDLSRQVAAELRDVAAKAHWFGVSLVVVVAVLVSVAAVSASINTVQTRRLARENTIGVDRIVDCTTRGQPCYEEEQAKQSFVVADALLALNQEHIAIECVLLKVPPSRTQADIDDCRAKAAKQTIAAREKLLADVEAARQKAVAGATTTTTKKGG